MSGTWFMKAGDEIFSAIGPQTQTFVTRFLQEVTGLEGQHLTLIQVAYGLAPEALTPRHISERTPYGNPAATENVMADAVACGWFERAGEGRFVLSDRGREVAADFLARADGFVAALAPASGVDLGRIASLLRKVVDRAKSLAEPGHKPALAMAAMFDRADTAPSMVQVRRRLLDIFAFRDDAHVAAWQPHGISGQAWEAFTYVWRGQASSAAELAKELPYRHYDDAAYAAALDELEARGWICEIDGRWEATQAGKELREQAEATTDRLFGQAWAALDEAETDELKALLQCLAEAVTPQG